MSRRQERAQLELEASLSEPSWVAIQAVATPSQAEGAGSELKRERHKKQKPKSATVSELIYFLTRYFPLISHAEDSIFTVIVSAVKVSYSIYS